MFSTYKSIDRWLVLTLSLIKRKLNCNSFAIAVKETRPTTFNFLCLGRTLLCSILQEVFIWWNYFPAFVSNTWTIVTASSSSWGNKYLSFKKHNQMLSKLSSKNIILSENLPNPQHPTYISEKIYTRKELERNSNTSFKNGFVNCSLHFAKLTIEYQWKWKPN